MYKVAYAIVIAVALIALPTTAKAEGIDPTPHDGPPCNWFDYNLNPPVVAISPECMPWPLNDIASYIIDTTGLQQSP